MGSLAGLQLSGIVFLAAKAASGLDGLAGWAGGFFEVWPRPGMGADNQGGSLCFPEPGFASRRSCRHSKPKNSVEEIGPAPIKAKVSLNQSWRQIKAYALVSKPAASWAPDSSTPAMRRGMDKARPR